jgi:hypothetical protein
MCLSFFVLLALPPSHSQIAECQYLIAIYDATSIAHTSPLDPNLSPASALAFVRSSLESARQHFADATMIAPGDVVGVVVANKSYEASDAGATNGVAASEGAQIAESLGMHFTQTNANTGRDIDIPFVLIANQAYANYLAQSE